MKIQVQIPEERVLSVEGLTEELERLSTSTLPPFVDELVDFCSAFSHELFSSTETARYPDLKALAFQLRRGNVVQWKKDFECLQSTEFILVPRGVAFHIPPANVETMFIYSWLFSLLVGNSNIIRLSSNASERIRILCSALKKIILSGKFEKIRKGTLFLTYGHEHEINEAISSRTDVRVIWGGDETIRSIREISLNPTAKELVFADRFSLAALETSHFLNLSGEQQDQVVHNFFNDAYWFDQKACSSPRLVVWCGSAVDSEKASGIFFGKLNLLIQKQRHLTAWPVAFQKLEFAFDSAARTRDSRFSRLSNELMVIHLSDLRTFSRDHCGAGLFYTVHIESLTDLIPFVEKKDQTLTYNGFSDEILRDFARQLNGRGVDRIVKMGSALEFHRIWDGLDLLQEFSKRIAIA